METTERGKLTAKYDKEIFKSAENMNLITKSQDNFEAVIYI